MQRLATLMSEGGGGRKSMGGRLKTSQLKTSRVAPECSKLAEKVQAFRPLLGRNAIFILPFPHFSLFRFIRVLLFAVLRYDTRAFKIFTLNDPIGIFDIVRFWIPLLEHWANI